MKAYRRSGGLAPLIHNLGTWWRWVVNPTAWRHHIWGKSPGRLQLKPDGTRWRTGGEVKVNWRMEWVASTLHTTPEHGVTSITTADAHTSAASSRLNWRPRRVKWTRPFRRKTKSGFCACAIPFQLASTSVKGGWTGTTAGLDTSEKRNLLFPPGFDSGSSSS